MSSLETKAVEQEQQIAEQQEAPHENGEQIHPLAGMQRGMREATNSLFEAFESQREAAKIVRA